MFRPSSFFSLMTIICLRGTSSGLWLLVNDIVLDEIRNTNMYLFFFSSFSLLPRNYGLYVKTTLIDIVVHIRKFGVQ